MLISHLPAGYIDTFLSKKIWQKKLTKHQKFTLLILGAFLGLLPDIDILYHYLFNAELSHRELITHSPFLYIIGALILFIIGLLIKNNFLKSFSFLFFLSPFIHLLLDTTTAGIPLFYPFSHNLYGLLMIPALNYGIYGQYIYVFLYGAEILIIFLCIIILAYQFLKNIFIKKFILISSIFFLLIFIIFMAYLNNNLYPKNSLQYYGDIDNDNLINMRDLDMDGDNITNINDIDADGDGLLNIEDVQSEINKMIGMRYDFSEDKYFNFLSRFGLLSSSDLILKTYDMSGIFLGEEMKYDREINQSGYDSSPQDDTFNQSFNNIYSYLKHNNYLSNDKNNLGIGDLIFWGNESNITDLTIISKIEDDEIFVLRGDKLTNRIISKNLTEISDLSNFVSYGKILK